jgi:RNA polymerase sigma-70 factor, ECF subfamily
VRTRLQPASSDYKRLSDEELVHRYTYRQDQIAINFLFERYGHLVLGVCLKYLKTTSAATEASQKIFIQLLEDLYRYKVTHFKSWLLQVVKNYCLMQKDGKVAVSNNEFVTNQSADSEIDLHHKLEEGQLFEQLDKAVQQLPADEKTCTELFYINKLNYAAISAQTKYSVKEVKANLQKGIANLRNKMEALVDVAK